jgi:PAS domain S-box-containing protein
MSEIEQDVRPPWTAQRSTGIIGFDGDGSLCHANAAAADLLGVEPGSEHDGVRRAVPERTVWVGRAEDPATLSDLVRRAERDGSFRVRVRVEGSPVEELTVEATVCETVDDGQRVTLLLHPAAESPTASRNGNAASGGDGADAVLEPGLLLDSMPVSAAVLDAQGRIQVVNEAWRAFARENDADPVGGTGVGANYLDVCRGGDAFARRAREGIEAVIAGESDAFEMEYPCHSPTVHRWFRMRALPLGEGDGAVVTHENVTRQKEREQHLRLMEAAIEHAGDSVIITEAEPIDEPGPRIVYVNEATTELTGYDREELLGATPRILQGPETSREALDRIREALERWEPVRVTVRNYTKDDRAFWNELLITPVADESGWYTHWVSVQRDVTEQRETAQILARQTAHLGGIIESAMDAIVTVDEDQRICIFNPAAEAMFGYEAREVYGKPLDVIIPEDKRSMHADHVKRFAASGETSRHMGDLGHVYGRRKNGETFPIEASIARIEAGDDVRYMAILRDVTERVEQREALEAARQEAEEANRLKSALLANMNHEIRTPLTSITGFSELLKEELDGPYGRHAELIYDSSRRLMHTLDAVMQLSKLQAGAAALSPEPMNLVDVVASEVEEHVPDAEAKDVSLRGPSGAKTLEGRWDATAVRQIVHVLVQNAVKFTGRGGRVTVSVNEGDDRAVVEVEDTGIGIAPESRERIFDPFVQESEGLRRAYEGSGLGLTIAQRYADEMGATIDVESTPGEGSTFAVRLPKNRTAGIK